MKTTIIGDGGWGTALAMLLNRKGREVWIRGEFPEYLAEMKMTRMNRKFLPGFPIPGEIKLVHDLGQALAGAEAIIFAFPSQYYSGLCRRIKPYLEGAPLIISAGKGLEVKTGRRLSLIVSETLQIENPVILSGPSHAEEVARRLPASVVAASRSPELACRAQELLMEERFRVYTHDDVIGVELGGAVKNVIAIAAGICDGLGFGDNTKAALLTRGIVEIARLGVALGARKETFWGLSGIGDLMATAFSPYGRNHRFGKMIGEGISVSRALASTEMVVEGVKTAAATWFLARQLSVEMPISREIYQVLEKEKPPLRAVRDLMTRAPKHEDEETG